jgi:hypothetical protein
MILEADGGELSHETEGQGVPCLVPVPGYQGYYGLGGLLMAAREHLATSDRSVRPGDDPREGLEPPTTK